MKTLLMCALLTSGCAEPLTYNQHPTPEQMSALLNAPVPVKGKSTQAPFELQINPMFASVGDSMWVTCSVPERYGTGYIRWGIEDVNMSERMLDHTQNRMLIQYLPCGTHVVSCTIRTAKGTQRTADIILEVKGSICDGKI